MKFVLACYGVRGDVDPGVVVGRELRSRGHDVRIAVSPNLVGFAESAGLTAVGYGLDPQALVDAQRNYFTCFFRTPWKVHELIRLARESRELASQSWGEMSKTLTSLADGADLLIAGPQFEEPVANVAEYYDIPFAALHFFPVRAHGQLVRYVPAPLIRSAMTANDWLNWRGMKRAEDAQRRELGLPRATGPAARRITDRGSLEIQAYDQVCFPGLAAEWARWNGQRPFVGALTMESPTDADEEVLSWIAAGTPPIYFGFGSISLDSAADMLTMIGGACAQLGERALVCAAGTDFSRAPHFDHVEVVGAMNFAAIFPACRAVVHHGGGGTTATGLRAGVPTLALWTLPDQPLWGAAVKRLKVGISRRFSTTTEKSLVADLRTILAPEYATRAREIATRMTKSTESVTAAADLLENFARLRRVR
jgi:UDP:flavonoid glycosyltransferase YjiC (YdhE family)